MNTSSSAVDTRGRPDQPAAAATTTTGATTGAAAATTTTGTTTGAAAPRVEANPNHARRWWILAILGVAQLMIILDVSIVNIALPSAQRDLGFSNDQRHYFTNVPRGNGLMKSGNAIIPIDGRIPSTSKLYGLFSTTFGE